MIGVGFALYGALKGAIAIAILRRRRRAAEAGAIVFTSVAIGTLVVLLAHVSVLRVALGVLDVAVAAVVWNEVIRARRARPPT
jgi:uncharacterized membrane protein